MDDDNITNQTDLIFSVNDVQPNADVTVTATLEGSSQTIESTFTDDGSRDYTVELALSEGVWNVIAIQTVANIPSTAGEDLFVTVDTTVPSFLEGSPTDVSELGASADRYHNFADEAAAPELVLEISAWQTDDATARVTHSVIGTNSTNDTPVVCDGTDDDQDLTDQSQNRVDMAAEFIDQGCRHHDRPLELRDCGRFWQPLRLRHGDGYCGEQQLLRSPIGPVERDTLEPAFEDDRPALRDTDYGVIENSERNATNLISAGNTQANDIISYAVSSNSATCNADFDDGEFQTPCPVGLTQSTWGLKDPTMCACGFGMLRATLWYLQIRRCG